MMFRNIQNIIKFLFLLFVLEGCSNDIAPTVMYTPKTQIELGELQSHTLGQIILLKSGYDKINYTVKTNKQWLTLEKTAGSMTGASDTIKLSVNLLANDILKGQNEAEIEITTFDNKIIKFTCTGLYTETVVNIPTSSIILGKIKTERYIKIPVSKLGLEDANIKIEVDQPWMTFISPKTPLTNNDSILVTVNKTMLPGNFVGHLKVTPIILGQIESSQIVEISGFFDDTIDGNIFGHTLVVDEIWAGDITLYGDIVVPNNLKLTIKPGSVIKVVENSNPIELKIEGTLAIQGNSENIVRIESQNPSAAVGAWLGFKIYGNFNINYCMFRNCLTALYFIKLNDITTNKLSNILFDRVNIGILNWNSPTIIENVTFTNTKQYGIHTIAKNATIINSEFLDSSTYLDLIQSGNETQININKCNFSNKINTIQNNLEFDSKSNKITANAYNCYLLKEIFNGNINGNSYNIFNPQAMANVNVGSGIRNPYASARFKK